VDAIFTMPGVTQEAIKEVEAVRAREVIVILKKESELFRKGRISAEPLIMRKRQELQLNGRVYFWTGRQGGFHHRATFARNIELSTQHRESFISSCGVTPVDASYSREPYIVDPLSGD
jgi:hypothetical protein